MLSRGPLVEILRAWHGELAWEPERVLAPVAIMRGGWDGLATDSDARWLTSALARASEKRDIKIDRGTHLMHLETMRFALWQESVAFLLADQQLSHEVLKDQAEDLVHLWRGIIALHPHLSGYSKDLRNGEIDREYGARVAKRFVQWVLDTARAEYDEDWLDYQHEIGLRHHRTKKNCTDGAHTTAHIRGRDLIAFAAATVAPMRPYLEKGGHSAAVVDRMQQAWWKSMILQVTLWSQPYMNPGDF